MAVEQLGIPFSESDFGPQYRPSSEGNLNDALTPEQQAEMRKLMDEAGHGVGILDFDTNEVIDRPAGKTPHDDMLWAEGELPE